MRSQPGPFYMHVPVSVPTFLAICDHRDRTGCRQELVEMADAAITAWLDEQAAEITAECGQPLPLSGYQWKRLFLPDGTVIRTIFKGKQYTARVEKARMVSQGEEVSPSQFAKVGGATRNAWKVLWLLFPGQRDWKLADDCRPEPRRRAT